MLDRQGLITRNDSSAMLDVSDVAPGLMKLTQIGMDYFKLLDLDTMHESEFYFLDQLRE